MAFNFYDTHTLLASVQQLPPLHTFLLDRYFPTNAATDIFATNDVLVEYKKGHKESGPRSWHPERAGSRSCATATK